MPNIYLPWHVVETRTSVMIKSSEVCHDGGIGQRRTVCYFPISGKLRRDEQRAIADIVILSVQAHSDAINHAVKLVKKPRWLSITQIIKGCFK